MNAFIDKLINDDFVWTAIAAHLPSKTYSSSTGFTNINCPMCVTFGHRPDKKMRCGIHRDAEGILITCFNCGFKTRYKMGEPLSKRMRAFLAQVGVSSGEIDRINHRAWQLSKVIGDSGQEVKHKDDSFRPDFPEKKLPDDTLPLIKWAELGCADPNFLQVAEYAMSRGDEVSTHAMWCPEPDWNDRMIIPFRFREMNIGWTGRLVETIAPATDEKPKYMSHVPTDYLYNCDVITRRDREFVLMPEGVLDGLAVEGVSPLGAKLSPRQGAWLRDCGKTVIVIPDPDKSGQRLIDSALEYGFKVAFPRITSGGNNWWEANVKDCAEAVRRYGKLYTIRSILETATDKALEINFRRKRLA